MDGVIFIGTDTGVGKTVICAGVLKLLTGTRPVVFWKPIQTGTIVGDDTQAVKSLTDLSPENFAPPAYRFPEPLSPHMAALKWGKKIEIDSLVDSYKKIKTKDNFVVVEGAGGVLVPLNESTLQIHLIKKLGLPVIIISQDRVGAINQTLLSVNALRAENIPILGVVLTRARKTLGNAEAISTFGKVDVLAQFDPSEDSRTIVARVAADSRLRTLFQVDKLPK